MFEFVPGDGIYPALALLMVLSLLYVGRRVTMNTRAVRSGNRQASLVYTSQVYAKIAEDEALASLFRRGLNDFSDLDGFEKVRFHYLLQNIVSLFANNSNALEENIITQAEYESIRATTMAVLQMDGGKLWWQDAQNAYPAELRTALNTQGDVSYALGDIFPYFLIDTAEKKTLQVQPRETINPVACQQEAANEEQQEVSESANHAVGTDWRRGLVRRRSRQNFYPG